MGLNGSSVTLKWVMGDAFNQYATTVYLRTHTTSDPNPELKGVATLTGKLSGATLSLHGVDTYTDASTGKVLETDDWPRLKLFRVTACPFTGAPPWPRHG